MSFDDSFPKRVAIARNSLGLTQSDLAKRVGVVPRQIAAYEGGEARPRQKALENLAAALGSTTEWLTTGAGDGPNISFIKRTVTLREIPVLTHVQARFNSLDELLSTASVKDFIPAPNGANEDCFALEIFGDSMTSPEGISFPAGSIVTFDSALQADHGDYVICALDDYSEATFKQLIIDQGVPHLRPLNPRYQMIKPEFLEVVGVAIHTQIPINRERWHAQHIDSEFDRLLTERNKTNADFWTSPNLTDNAHLDERLQRLDELTSRLEKLVSGGSAMQVVQKADYPSPSSMVEGKDKKN